MTLGIACNNIMKSHLSKHHADATVEQLPSTEFDLLQAAYVEYAGVLRDSIIATSVYGCDQLVSMPDGPPRPGRLSRCALFVQRFCATHAAKLQGRDCSTLVVSCRSKVSMGKSRMKPLFFQGAVPPADRQDC